MSSTNHIPATFLGLLLLALAPADSEANEQQTNVVLSVSISLTAYIQTQSLPALPTATVQRLATKDILASVGSDIGSGMNVFPSTARLLLKQTLGSADGPHFVVRVRTNDTDISAPTLRLATAPISSAGEIQNLRLIGGGKTNGTDYQLTAYQLRSSNINFDLQGFSSAAISSLLDNGSLIADDLLPTSLRVSVLGFGSVSGEAALFQGTIMGAGRKIEIVVTNSVQSSSYPGTFTYHNDNLRTGQNLNETVLTHANVNSSTFGKLFAYTVDGLMIASPLYVASVVIPSKGVYNVIYVATEHDSVYAFDADGLTTTPLWRVSFINPGSGITTVPPADTGETGDIPNEIGITGTPVIDPASSTLYVVSKRKRVSGGVKHYEQHLHALSLSTGAEKFGGPVLIQATSPTTFDALHENQRAALLLANGVVYIAFGSHGDNGPYYGWVIGYNVTTLEQTIAYNTAPNSSQAGVWMSGDGPSADTAGNIYFITGNGTFNASLGGSDYGSSFEKLSPDGVVLDYFTPKTQDVLTAGDLDLGSAGELLLPDQPGAHPHEILSAGKNGTIYLVDRDNMSHYDPNADNVVQVIDNIFTNATGIEGGNFSAPVFFNGSVYFSPVADRIQKFHLDNGLLSTTPVSWTSTVFNGRGGSMAISANGNSDPILWALESNGPSSPGVLHAYEALDLSSELYNSTQAGSRDSLSPWQKFTVPLVANGKVFVAGTTQLTAYGLLP